MAHFGQIVGLLIAICTLVGLFTGGATYVLHTFNSWYRKEPVVLLRTQRVEESFGHSKYFVNFSIANRRDSSITLNAVSLEMGDYSFGSTMPGMLWLAFKKFSREIKLDFVGHPQGKPFPLLRAYGSDDSMGSSQFAIVTDRGSIGPHEQVDVDLIVDVSRPEKFRSKYPTIWSLGGQIAVRYEDQTLKEEVVQYPIPSSRDKALPF